jgi:hypothetical protein
MAESDGSSVRGQGGAGIELPRPAGGRDRAGGPLKSRHTGGGGIALGIEQYVDACDRDGFARAMCRFLHFISPCGRWLILSD